MASPAPLPLAALHPAALSLALASSDNRLRIWSTTSTSTPAPLFNPAHLAETFSCIAWLVPESGPKRKQPGETAAKQQNAELVAVGTANGRIVVWDVRSATVFKVLGEDGTAHTGAVNDICFSGSTNTLFSCSDDRQIIVWNVHTGQIIKKIKADNQPVKKIALSKDGSTLASGSTRIKIWDVSSFQVKSKLSGHPTPITTLKFSPDGKKLLSGSSQDRFLHVWNVDVETTQAKETAAQPRGFTSDNPPLFADITQRSKHKSQHYDILGVSDGGIINVWSFGDSDSTAARTKSDSQIKIVDAAGRSTILSAQFCSDQHVMIARGTSVKPAFDKVAYIKDGDLVKETTITTQEGDVLTESKKATPKQQKQAVPDQLVSVLGPSNMGGGLTEPKLQGVTPAPASETTPIPPSAMNLQQLLDAAADKDGGSKPGASATSLAALLSQGLRMGDKAIVDTVLNCKDPTVINATVISLPPSSLLPFLEYLMSNFQASPAAALLLVPWMRALLLHRASYFMSVGDMVSRISGLYQHIESRLGVFKKLLKLSGRLHLILSHISKKDSLNIENISNVPVTVYEEEEDGKLGSEDEEVDTDEEEEEGDGADSSEGGENWESDDDSAEAPDEEAMSE